MVNKDALFLKNIDDNRNKFYYARISILDNLDKVIKIVEGRVQEGSSITIDGNSSVRRTCNISVIAEAATNDLTNIDNFLSINRKIKIAVGILNEIDYSKDILYYEDKNRKSELGFPEQGEVGKIYVDNLTQTYWIWRGNTYQQIDSLYDYKPEVVWFPQGVFVIGQPSISHTTSGCIINLSCKDKMSLLNGELGGNFPTSVTFHEYNQTIGELEVTKDPIKDINLEPNTYTIYKFNNKYYSWTKDYGWEETSKNMVGKIVSIPQLIYDIIFTSVVNYGGEDPSRIIINDVPKELKQLVRYTGASTLYYNTETEQYTTDESYLTEDGVWDSFVAGEDVGYVYTDFIYPGELITNIGDNVCSVLDKIKETLGNYEYFYDIDGNFVFQEKRNYLNISYDVTKEYYNEQRFYLDDNKIKVLDNNTLKIIGHGNYKTDIYGDQKSIYTFEEGSGLVTSYSNNINYGNLKNDYHIWGKNDDGYAIHYHLVIKEMPGEMISRDVVFLKDENGYYNGRIRLTQEGDNEGDIYRQYTPLDWRAELYLQGLEVAKGGGRPDIYQQELLDLFDSIYEWGYYDKDKNWIPQGRFKNESVKFPNGLQYFIDYLEPIDRLYGCAVDDINTKIYSYQQDKIKRLYDNKVPNVIIINNGMDINSISKALKKCDDEGQDRSLVNPSLYKKLSIGTLGYSAQEVARDLLYQYTNYNESITLSCVPIYYLDANKRITVNDKKSNIYGDYIIQTITLPISPASTMNLTASRALSKF